MNGRLLIRVYRKVLILDAGEKVKIGGKGKLGGSVEKHCLSGASLALFRHASNGRQCEHHNDEPSPDACFLYSGQVQGVGFRYTVKSLAIGFEVAGMVRNLADGRVELVVEGDRVELNAFRQAIRDEGLDHFIRDERVDWSEAQGDLRGFEISR